MSCMNANSLPKIWAAATRPAAQISVRQAPSMGGATRSSSSVVLNAERSLSHLAAFCDPTISANFASHLDFAGRSEPLAY